MNMLTDFEQKETHQPLLFNYFYPNKKSRIKDKKEMFAGNVRLRTKLDQKRSVNLLRVFLNINKKTKKSFFK